MVSDEVLSTLPHSNPNPVICCGREGDIRWYNPAAEQLASDLGLNELSDLLPVEHDDLIERCRGHQGQVSSASAHVSMHHIQWTYSLAGQTISLYGFDITHYQEGRPENGGLVTCAVLDCLSVGALLVDVNLHVSYLNRSARQILSGETVLSYKDECLVSQSKKALRQLSEAVAVTQSHLSAAETVPQVLSIPRPGKKSLLELMVVPTAVSSQQPAVAIIFLFHPDQKTTGSMDVLRALYGLTLAEARLTVQLVKGYSLHQAASMLQVKVGTVRAQLTQVFRKTATTRQPELVTRILTGPAGIWMGETS